MIEIRLSGYGIAGGREVLAYDDKGRLHSQTRYDSRGTVEGKEIRTYDNEGRLFEKSDAYETYRYNARGQLILEIRNVKPDDPNFRKVSYEYDKNGLIVKEEEFTNKGLRQSFDYTYEFDSHGNWIKQVSIGSGTDGKFLSDETYRVINYY